MDRKRAAESEYARAGVDVLKAYQRGALHFRNNRLLFQRGRPVQHHINLRCRRVADGLDEEEAPSAYKDIRSVLRAQKDLIKIARTLQPMLNYKGLCVRRGRAHHAGITIERKGLILCE